MILRMMRESSKFHSLLCLKLLLVFPGLSAQMSQQAYVWQRNWTEPLKSAIHTQRTEVDALTVLCAELHPADPFGVNVVDLDYEVLKSSGVPVTLALRLNWNPTIGVEGSFERGFGEKLKRAIAGARHHGLEPAAVEIDFDCPTSKLRLYAEQLRAIRQALDGVPLSITTLPTWMNRPGVFQKLIAEVDHFVLQVHSIKRPDHFDTKVSLCDLEDSLRWTKQAAAYGKPYHVALPTYGYRLAYDESDNLVEVAGEDASSVKDPSWRYRVIRAEPDVMAELVRRLESHRPKNCLGVIWYRLPIGAERLNWDKKTWQLVKRGRGDNQSWRLELVKEGGGLIQLDLVQESAIAIRPPKQLLVSSEGVAPQAWDGQRNYTVKVRPGGGLIWQWPDLMDAPLLPQGTRWTIGWLRLGADAELNYSMIHHAD